MVRPYFVNTKMTDTFQVGEVRTVSRVWNDKTENNHVRVILRQDRLKTIYTTSEHDILFWLVNIGGFSSSVMTCFAVLAQFLSRYIFVSELLEKLYLVKRHNENHEKNQTKKP